MAAGCDGGYIPNGCAFGVRTLDAKTNGIAVMLVAHATYTITVHFDGALITSQLIDSSNTVLATASLPLVAASLSLGLVVGRNNTQLCTTSYKVAQGASSPVEYIGSPLWRDPAGLTNTLAPQLRAAAPGQSVCGVDSNAAVLAGTMPVPFDVTFKWSGQGIYP